MATPSAQLILQAPPLQLQTWSICLGFPATGLREFSGLPSSQANCWLIVTLLICVCVCVCEIERERQYTLLEGRAFDVPDHRMLEAAQFSLQQEGHEWLLVWGKLAQSQTMPASVLYGLAHCPEGPLLCLILGLWQLVFVHLLWALRKAQSRPCSWI